MSKNISYFIYTCNLTLNYDMTKDGDKFNAMTLIFWKGRYSLYNIFQANSEKDKYYDFFVTFYKEIFSRRSYRIYQTLNLITLWFSRCQNIQQFFDLLCAGIQACAIIFIFYWSIAQDFWDICLINNKSKMVNNEYAFINIYEHFSS